MRAAALGFALSPLPAHGQDLRDLLAVCGNGSDPLLAWCQEAALGVQAAQGALGLAASSGSDLAGSPSTLGWRTKGSPRYSLALRGGITRAPFPSFREVGELPGGSTTDNLYALHLTGAVGLFDGFSLGPTVGGFGSVDLTASAHWVTTPVGAGFPEDRVGWGVGGRLGVLRESFSLPGVTASGSYRFLGRSELWSTGSGGPGTGRFDLGVFSLRGLMGKDIGGIGFVAGAGCDRYGGDFSFTLSGSEPGSDGPTVEGELQSDRRLYFLGASLTFLALQLSGEVGWAQGFDPGLPLPSARGYDPSSASYFGSVSLRLTF